MHSLSRPRSYHDFAEKKRAAHWYGSLNQPNILSGAPVFIYKTFLSIYCFQGIRFFRTFNDHRDTFQINLLYQTNFRNQTAEKLLTPKFNLAPVDNQGMQFDLGYVVKTMVLAVLHWLNCWTYSGAKIKLNPHQQTKKK